MLMSSSARELMVVHFAAERPSTFSCNIHNDGPVARKSLAGSSGPCRLVDQDPTCGFVLLVASLVPSLSCCQ